MPINRLLKEADYKPEEVVRLNQAFALALSNLGLLDRNDPICEISWPARSSTYMPLARTSQKRSPSWTQREALMRLIARANTSARKPGQRQSPPNCTLPQTPLVDEKSCTQTQTGLDCARTQRNAKDVAVTRAYLIGFCSFSYCWRSS